MGTSTGDKLIDVVIVNWNSGMHLAACLRALAAPSERHRIRGVTIVDNGSTDGSLDFQLPPDLPVFIDRAGSNLGFARGSNRAARQGTAPYILLLNPDASIEPGALDAVIASFNRSDAIGIVGLRLCDQAGNTLRTCSRFPTARAFIVRALGLNLLPGLKHLGPFMRDWAHTESRIVDQVMGACCAVPRALFEDIGGFDERFFLYYEDVDLAKRVQKINRISWFETAGAARHIGGGSSAAIPGRRLFYILSSRFAYARKHFSLLGYLATLFVTLLIEPWSRLAAEVVRRGPVKMFVVLSGYAILFRTLAGAKSRG
ncbi:MAG: glycosyl transferase [Rhodospirillales bacterium]|nr:glycosyl transferase [Rhodospirillales bacterium]